MTHKQSTHDAGIQRIQILNNTNASIIVQTLRHEQQYDGEHVLAQPLDGTQAADMRRGNPADAHNTRLKHQSQTLKLTLQLPENQPERAHTAGQLEKTVHPAAEHRHKLQVERRNSASSPSKPTAISRIRHARGKHDPSVT